MTQLDLLLDRLLILLNNDKYTVRKLVKEAMDRYPKQDATWYVEKVIWDVTEKKIVDDRRRKLAIPLPLGKSLTLELGQRTAEKMPIEPTYRLVKFFNGDRAAAKRLLNSIQQRYPDKSEQWVLDKVAWDLWRDRGM